MSPMGNRKEWKKEKECCVCQDTFSKSNKRLGCKFCHHAVCRDCSPSRMLHPVSKKPERICLSCAATVEIRLSDSVGSFSAADSKSIEDIEAKLQDEEVLRQEFEKKYTLALARAERAEAILDDYKRKMVKTKEAEQEKQTAQTEKEEMRKALRVIAETVVKDAPQMIKSGRWSELAEEVIAAYNELTESKPRSMSLITPPQHSGESELSMYTGGSVEILGSNTPRLSIRHRTSLPSASPREKKNPFVRLSIHKESLYVFPARPKRFQLGFTHCQNVSVLPRQPVAHQPASLSLASGDRCLSAENRSSIATESSPKREPEAEATCVAIRSGVSTPTVLPANKSLSSHEEMNRAAVDKKCLQCEKLKKYNEELLEQLQRFEQEPIEKVLKAVAKPSEQVTDKACACVTF